MGGTWVMLMVALLAAGGSGTFRPSDRCVLLLLKSGNPPPSSPLSLVARRCVLTWAQDVAGSPLTDFFRDASLWQRGRGKKQKEPPSVEFCRIFNLYIRDYSDAQVELATGMKEKLMDTYQNVCTSFDEEAIQKLAVPADALTPALTYCLQHKIWPKYLAETKQAVDSFVRKCLLDNCNSSPHNGVTLKVRIGAFSTGPRAIKASEGDVRGTLVYSRFRVLEQYGLEGNCGVRYRNMRQLMDFKRSSCVTRMLPGQVYWVTGLRCRGSDFCVDPCASVFTEEEMRELPDRDALEQRALGCGSVGELKQEARDLEVAAEKKESEAKGILDRIRKQKVY